MARRTLFSGLLLVALFSFSGVAMAALNDPSASYNGLLELVRSSASAWDARLTGYAQKLFWGLAVISFVWTFFPLVFKQADFGEIVGELIRFILVIGFFYALLLNATEWADAIVNSFRQAGAAAAGTGQTEMRPSDVFALAVELADTIGKADTWNPLEGAAIAIAGVLVLLCFAFIAAFMGVTLVESYVVINASVLFMGFGGSPWTREYAIALARYAVSVGAKLFVLTLIIGLITTSAKAWQAAYTQDDASMWTMVGLSLVCAYLARTIPDIIQGLITGTSMNGGMGIGTMAAVAAAGATAGAAAAASF
ncbi:P-type conjugative transfer protein TrbL, partial [Acinetobacter baumannii]|uniref:P-type conjugative transfer protein TrbL n=1 Tax=Acinetobacter baumannii TaxID=470 RepID=UPI0034E2B236